MNIRYNTIESYFTGETRALIVAIVDDVVVGYLDMYFTPSLPKTCTLYRLYVLPTHRTRGIGTGLKNLAENMARHWGCDTVKNDVEPSSIGFWRSADYEVDQNVTYTATKKVAVNDDQLVKNCKKFR